MGCVGASSPTPAAQNSPCTTVFSGAGGFLHTDFSAVPLGRNHALGFQVGDLAKDLLAGVDAQGQGAMFQAGKQAAAAAGQIPGCNLGIAPGHYDGAVLQLTVQSGAAMPLFAERKAFFLHAPPIPIAVLAAKSCGCGGITAKLLQFPKSGWHGQNRCGQLALGLQKRKQQLRDQLPPHLAQRQGQALHGIAAAVIDAAILYQQLFGAAKAEDILLAQALELQWCAAGKLQI